MLLLPMGLIALYSITSGGNSIVNFTLTLEHFKKFSNITELDRNAVIQLVQSVKIFEKKQIEITFRYQSEYEETIKMFHSKKEVI